MLAVWPRFQPPFDRTFVDIVEGRKCLARGELARGFASEAHLHALVARTQPHLNAVVASTAPGTVILRRAAALVMALFRIELGIDARDRLCRRRPPVALAAISTAAAIRVFMQFLAGGP